MKKKRSILKGFKSTLLEKGSGCVCMSGRGRGRGSSDRDRGGFSTKRGSVG